MWSLKEFWSHLKFVKDKFFITAGAGAYVSEQAVWTHISGRYILNTFPIAPVANFHHGDKESRWPYLHHPKMLDNNVLSSLLWYLWLLLLDALLNSCPMAVLASGHCL